MVSMVVSRGFDANEVTVDGKVKGGRLEFNPAAAKDGGFTPGERIIGGTSGAVGELISDQSPSNYLYYFPITGTFVQNETVTGQTSSAYVTLLIILMQLLDKKVSYLLLLILLLVLTRVVLLNCRTTELMMTLVHTLSPTPVTLLQMVEVL